MTQPKLVILFIAANPRDTDKLKLDKEFNAIRDQLLKSAYRANVELRSEWAVNFGELQQHLLHYKPNIVHFGGHGSKEGAIVLADDEDDGSQVVSPEKVAELFSILRENINCVVLNACYSEKQAHLLADSIDFIVGMSSPIEDSDAIDFADGFYLGLCGGKDLQTSFKLGCNRIDPEGKGAIVRDFKLLSSGPESSSADRASESHASHDPTIPQLIALRADPAKAVLLRPQNVPPVDPPTFPSLKAISIAVIALFVIVGAIIIYFRFGEVEPTVIAQQTPVSQLATKALTLVNSLAGYGDSTGRRAGNRGDYILVFDQIAEWDLGEPVNELVAQIQELVREAPGSDVGGHYDMAITEELDHAISALRVELISLGEAAQNDSRNPFLPTASVSEPAPTEPARATSLLTPEPTAEAIGARVLVELESIKMTQYDGYCDAGSSDLEVYYTFMIDDRLVARLYNRSDSYLEMNLNTPAHLLVLEDGNLTIPAESAEVSLDFDNLDSVKISGEVYDSDSGDDEVIGLFEESLTWDEIAPMLDDTRSTGDLLPIEPHTFRTKETPSPFTNTRADCKVTLYARFTKTDDLFAD